MSTTTFRMLQNAATKAIANAEAALHRCEDKIVKAKRKFNNATRRHRAECRRKLAQAFDQRRLARKRLEKALANAEKMKTIKHF